MTFWITIVDNDKTDQRSEAKMKIASSAQKCKFELGASEKKRNKVYSIGMSQEDVLKDGSGVLEKRQEGSWKHGLSGW